MTGSAEEVVACRSLAWSPPADPARPPLLRGCTLSVPAAALTTLEGPSGAGKTVLGTLLLRLRRPSSGSVLWHGTCVQDAPESELRPRRPRYQAMLQHAEALLPPHCTVGQCLDESARSVARLPAPEAAVRIRDLSRRLGLEALLARRPRWLSGGEQRRVSLARVVLARPAFAFLDEPDTGLDGASLAEVLDLVRDCLVEEGTAVLLVTHREGVGRGWADHRWALSDGGVQHA